MASYSGLFNGVQGEDYVIPFTDANSAQRMLPYHLSKNRTTNRKMRELLATLIGVTHGSTALDTYVRPSAQVGDENLGGARTMETITVINRETTAADTTALNAFLFQTRQRSFVSSLDGSSPIGNVYSF